MKITGDFVKRLKRLRKGGRVEINGKAFTILGRKYHSAEDPGETDSTVFDLGDDFILSIEWDQPGFHKVIVKKGRFIVPIETTKWKNIKIEDIKIIN